jgi:hypothetical protein
MVIPYSMAMDDMLILACADRAGNPRITAGGVDTHACRADCGLGRAYGSIESASRVFPIAIRLSVRAAAHDHDGQHPHRRVGSSSIPYFMGAFVRRTMSTTEDSFMRFHTMPDDPTAAVGTARGKNLNSTLKTVKHMELTSHCDLKGLIIVIAAFFTLSHVETSFQRGFINQLFISCLSAGVLVAPAGSTATHVVVVY